MSYIDALLSVELEINKHYQKLKKRLNKIYYSYEKKKFKENEEDELHSKIKFNKNKNLVKVKEEEILSDEEDPGDNTDDIMEKIVSKNNKVVSENRVVFESDTSINDFKLEELRLKQTKKYNSNYIVNNKLTRAESFISPARNMEGRNSKYN